MKKIYLALSIGLFAGLYSQTVLPSGLTGFTTENYIYSRQYLDATTASSDSTKQMQSVTYYDGLGRPKQNVAIKASPTGKDLVTPIVYDGFGRQRLDYLPIPQGGTTHGQIYQQTLQTNPNSPIPFPVTDTDNFYKGETIYSEKKIENSPLDRIQQQIQVGTLWQSKPINFGYETNIGDVIINFTTSATSWTNNSTNSNLIKASHFADAKLYKNKVTDEDGNTIIEFKNGEGHTLLIRKNDGTNDVDTYYVYNEFNQLAFVISPEATKAIKNLADGTILYSDSNNILLDLCYQYRYDGKNRLVEKKLPGKGWEYMVYDNQDRLVMTQDANLGANKKWLFTKYDQFGRVAYTGIYASTHPYNGIGRNTEQGNVSGIGSNNVARTSSSGFTAPGLPVYYDNLSANNYPNNFETILSVNYYDTYPPGSAALPTAVLGQSVLSQNSQTSDRSTKSLPTASYVKNIDNSGWTKSFIWYDTKGRPIGNHTINHLGGFTKTETLLDFSGTPQKTMTYHSRLNSTNAKVTIEENFTYDPQNRLVKHEHKVNGNAPEVLAENTYNEIGQLTRKKVGNNIQEIDYDYNIRGWMTKINDPANMGAKLFAYEIKYHNPDPTSPVVGKFNGNIAEIDWVFKDIPKKRYSYQYDGLNRLLNGIYSDPDAGISYNINGESLEYDLNGNITRLYRNTKHGKYYTPVQIDNLTYNYANGAGNSNRLQTITDASTNTLGYPGGGQTITYDANGNMTTMPDKGITQTITYNFLNLPTQIKQNANTTNYVYRADGVKLKKIYNLVNQLGSKIINTEYLDGFQYSTPNIEPIRKALEEKDDTTVSATKAGNEEAFLPLEDRLIAPGNPNEIALILSFFPTAEGYYDYENFRYIYQYKDHLGNVRVSFVKNSAGNLQVMDTNDYYPFGLSFMKPFGQSSVYDPMAIPYNYKYNGKELQETGMYDYGARMYMPDIGRWGVTDELSELQFSQSNYSYVAGNPIAFNDPTGMIPECPGGNCPDGITDVKTLPSGENEVQIEEVKLVGKKKESNDNVVSSFGRGFVGGAGSTWDFIKNQFTWQGYRDNLLNVATGGAHNGAQTIFGLYGVAENIPSYTGNDYAYGAGFIAEKALEIALLRRASKLVNVKSPTNAKEPVTDTLYKRPNNATTAAQRASVQGQPCVTCGATETRMVANHKYELVKEHYQTGTINIERMKSLDAVNSQCFPCSYKQGAETSAYSKEMKKIIQNRTGGQ